MLVFSLGFLFKGPARTIHRQYTERLNKSCLLPQADPFPVRERAWAVGPFLFACPVRLKIWVMAFGRLITPQQNAALNYRCEWEMNGRDVKVHTCFCWWDISANVLYESSDVKHEGLKTSTVSQTPSGHINWFSHKSPTPPNSMKLIRSINMKNRSRDPLSLIFPLHVLAEMFKSFHQGLKVF